MDFIIDKFFATHTRPVSTNEKLLRWPRKRVKCDYFTTYSFGFKIQNSFWKGVIKDIIFASAIIVAGIFVVIVARTFYLR